jgi:hypothetical protein
MRKTVALQLLGPVSLFGAIAIADGGAFALDRSPSSEWLWYLNLKWFALFQQSHYALQEAAGSGAQILLVGAPLIVVAALGIAFERTLLLATSSNLALAYVVFAALSWLRAEAPLSASVTGQYAVTTNSGIILLAVLVSLCALSFAVSHLIYLQKAVSETR